MNCLAALVHSMLHSTPHTLEQVYTMPIGVWSW